MQKMDIHTAVIVIVKWVDTIDIIMGTVNGKITMAGMTSTHTTPVQIGIGDRHMNTDIHPFIDNRGGILINISICHLIHMREMIDSSISGIYLPLLMRDTILPLLMRDTIAVRLGGGIRGPTEARTGGRDIDPSTKNVILTLSGSMVELRGNSDNNLAG